MPKPKQHFYYMSGMSGYMPDNVGCTETEEQAISCLLHTFDDIDDDLPEGESELSLMQDNLEEDGIHYFDHPECAGAQYAEVGICPNGTDCREFTCPDCDRIKCQCE